MNGTKLKGLISSVTLAAAALEVLLNKKDEVVHEDADTIVNFLLSSFGVKAFSMDQQ